MLNDMRSLDLDKRDAVCKSAVRLINQLGFDGVSIAKIAKDAKVSPATIYIYFENKEDMLKQLYLQLKQDMANFILKDFKPGPDHKANFKHLFYRHWFFFYQYPDSFAFIEQFANSPLLTGSCAEKGFRFYQPIMAIIHEAQQAGAIKPISQALYNALVFAPLLQLAKLHASGRQSIQPQDLEQVFEIIWAGLKTE
jgi:AcrR family transcriptional regulator